ncbi:MAG TPA: glucose 1-dehydrogenase [Myxococcota bacterium]|jgi:NAD(P)-dependent dehydrogenase (short-subunit alcohol dehydrogenase family)
MHDASSVSLAGKVAVVTGGGAGIGRAIAETFAACGAAVVVAERDAARASEAVAAIAARGGRALAVVGDVTQQDAVNALAERTLEALGRVDVLVNNVGDWLGFTNPFVESSDEQWRKLFDTNLGAALRCTRALAPAMIRRGEGGSIIHVTSIEAHRGIPGNVMYSAFKAATEGFARSLALELAPKRIRVNCIAPETTDTPQVPVMSWLPDELKARIPLWIPLGRFGAPDDLAGAALFLASDLSAWVTGTTLHVNGGALAAAGWYRTPRGGWTNTPIVTGGGLGG